MKTLLALSFSALMAGAAPAASLVPVVVSAALDGDTVVVQGVEQRVRLASIDAPETAHGRSRPGQAYSSAAQKWLERELVGRRGVAMRCVDEDRYGRSVCEFHRDGQNINREMVRAGLAWAYTANRRYVRDPQVISAQREATQARRGLWAQAVAVPPWEWRKTCWTQGQCNK